MELKKMDSKEKCIKPKDELQTSQPNNNTEITPLQDSASMSNGSRKVSREDIEFVQNLIERCLLMYMNRDEIVKTLLNRARIDPGFTTLVWQKLEEEKRRLFPSLLHKAEAEETDNLVQSLA